MSDSKQLTDELKAVKLYYFEDNLEAFLASFQSKQSPLVEKVLRQMARDELQFRNQRSLERRIRSSKVGRVKPLADFDWDWPKSIDQAGISKLFDLDFIKESRNVLFCGPEGVGKTMLAKNLAHTAATQGYSSLYTTASNMIVNLQAGETAGIFRARLRSYLRVDLLVIDEIGYLSFNNQAADLLFDVITKRYEKNSIVVTTNLAFHDWGKIFPGASCVTAMIDRFTHHCDIFNINAKSYRLHEAKESQKK